MFGGLTSGLKIGRSSAMANLNLPVLTQRTLEQQKSAGEPVILNIQDSQDPTHAGQTSEGPTIVWFRQDLRTADNPALWQACQRGTVVPVYIVDDSSAGAWAMGAASRWWLHHALESLDRSLDGKLNLFRGDALEILTSVAKELGATSVVWNRCYEPWRIERDAQLKSQLKLAGIEAHSYNGSLLWEPWQIVKADGTAYKVFTPYYRRGCLQHSDPRIPHPAPERLQASDKSECSLSLNCLNLLPKIPWYEEMVNCWQISESAAQQRLDEFIAEGLGDYREGRNYPNKANVSRLSPYFHFGMLSVNTAWHRAQNEGAMCANADSLDTFLSELGWREFSYYLLYHFPQLPEKNLQPRFENFPWNSDAGSDLVAWQTGRTGYPLVDAGMRELYSTGYMHNRVRMVVGSFLVKNLLIHWHSGERWFWDCLVDADLASNSASWQWIAGCGADAAPFFRIFNPITQSEKFDPKGDYIRRFVPELAQMPDKHIHAPWLAPAEVLQQAQVELGVNYPHPIVDIKQSRERALAAFKRTKETV